MDTPVTLEEVWKLFKETDRKMQETDVKMQETDRMIKDVTRSVGRLGNRLGDFVEDLVEPSVVRLFQERGIVVHEVHSKIQSTRGTESIEIDLLVVNDTDVVAVECKSQLTTEDIQEHLLRLSKFKRLFPRYADAHLMGAMATMVAGTHVAEYAMKKGLFLMQQSGENVVIVNGPHFEATVW